MRLLSFLFLFLFVMGTAAGNRAEIVLLAVSEIPEGYQGGQAYLTVEVAPGSGRVFVETSPLTKLDTQLSMRIGREVACNYLEIDCQRYDFFYTIRSVSSIVGGPSAGPAAAVASVAALKGWDIDKGMTLTGMLSSGGLIGAVGGLEEKIRAAPKAGIRKVLIPEGMMKDGDGSRDLKQLGDELGVDVVEVATFEEALWHFFKIKRRVIYSDDIEPPESYSRVMREVGIKLCNRAGSLEDALRNLGEVNQSGIKMAVELHKKGLQSIKSGRFYSGASFCFGSALKLRQMLYLNLSKHNFRQKEKDLASRLDSFEAGVDAFKLKDVNDLQTLMIIKERITEARGFLAMENMSAADLGYAEERLFSAELWARFFDSKGKEIQLDEMSLRESCLMRIDEARQRLAYLELFFPFNFEKINREITHAVSDFSNANYALCIFKAKKAKADSDSIMNSVGFTEHRFNATLRKKSAVVNDLIYQQLQNRLFPILGYSYYEYAQSLLESDPYSALVYLEYSLELSDMSDYLNPKRGYADIGLDYSSVFLLLTGVLFGMLLGMLMWRKVPSGRGVGRGRKGF